MFRIEIPQIAPTDLKRKLDSGETVAILDIREPSELTICKLNNTVHIPMGDLPLRLKELEPYKDAEIIVYCRSGGRSNQCAQFLRQNGYQALNLAGGILAWSDEVDPSVQKY